VLLRAYARWSMLCAARNAVGSVYLLALIRAVRNGPRSVSAGVTFAYSAARSVASARFILVATPSGITLAPEGGAHQSICTPLIGMSQDGLAAFEPAFADELAKFRICRKYRVPQTNEYRR
jgi:hypothetical protein